MPSSPSRHPSASSLSQTAEVTRNMKLWLQARLGNTTRLQSSSEIPLINLAVNTFHLKAQHLLLGAENVAPSYLPSRVALVVDEFYVSQMLKLKKALADNLRSTLERLHERTSCSIRSVAPQLLNMYVTRGQNAAEVLRQRILDRTRLYIAAQRNVIDGKRGFNADCKPFLSLCFVSNAYPSTIAREQIATLTGMSVDQITNWFQNQRNRRKREGRGLARPAPSQDAAQTIDHLFRSWDHSSELEDDDDELSDDETVVDEDEDGVDNDVFFTASHGSQVFPTKYVWVADATLLPPFQQFSTMMWPSRATRSQVSDAKPDFDELCTLFSQLKLDGKRSAKHAPQPRKSSLRETLGQTLTKVLHLCTGRHPAYVPPSQSHLLPAYTPPSSTSSSKETPQKSPKKRSGFPKRVPRSAPSHYPRSESTAPTSSSPSRTSSIRSVASSTITLGASRASSVVSDDTCSSDGLAKPPSIFSDLPSDFPIIAEPGFNYEIGLGSMDNNLGLMGGSLGSMDSGLEALFNDEQQWGEFISQLLADSSAKTNEWDWTVDQPLLDSELPPMPF
ncbi:hypothetical protein BDV98DRAFT_558822 [Pterulicium gracile]|uniref:Homeobox domain-containing protein n=1 Tax=Pterulicium gracile TaxID=1884261 RepID=A0A5C3QZX2_9AGAR|nr:hypothetical protein BDV98DRAFT_558822 [Pterula gracilis]